MSHTVTIAVQFKDMDVLEATCKKLNIPYEKKGTAHFYDGSSHTGFAVHFENWRYPLIIDSEANMYMDVYNGAWGNMEDINLLKMHYGVEKVKKQAKAKHYQVKEYEENGKPKLKIYINS